MATGQIDRAEMAALKALELAPTSAKPLFALAGLYKVKQNRIFEVQYWKRASAADHSYESEVAKAVCCLYFGAKKYREALDHLHRAEELNREFVKFGADTSWLNIMKGFALLRNGSLNDAYVCLRTVTSGPVPSAFALYYLGIAEAKLKKWMDARNSLTRAINIDSSHRSFYILLARVEFRMGRFADGWRSFRKAVDLIEAEQTASGGKGTGWVGVFASMILVTAK